MLKKIFNEFRQFISRGNVLDMATGVIMGAAFTSIVNSLVKDALMPFVGYVIGGINFADFKIVLSPATQTEPEVAVLYGSFIQQVINFVFVGLIVFVVVKVFNQFWQRKEAAPEPEPKPSQEAMLLAEIRDMLRQSRE